jgi:hypothetical protein
MRWIETAEDYNYPRNVLEELRTIKEILSGQPMPRSRSERSGSRIGVLGVTTTKTAQYGAEIFRI